MSWGVTIVRSGFSVLSTLALGGGLVVALAAPAQAAVPAGSCGDGTTFAVSSGPSVDAALVSSVTEAFAERGLRAAPASSADLLATIAPASEIAESGSATVMGVAISTGDLDPATATEGEDWAAVTGVAGDAAEQLLEDACGPLPAEEQDPADESVPAEDGSEAPAPAPAQEDQRTAAETQTVRESTSSTAKGVAPATGATSDRQEAPSANEEAAAPAPATAAPAAPAAPAPADAAAAESGATGSAPSSRPAAAAEAPVADKDCGDFGSRDEAQTFFEDNGGPSSDVHRLDADDDGQACEGSFSGEDGAVAAASASGDKDCADFGSQAEAQAFFTGHGGPTSDEHRLDRDNDGQACEDSLGGDNASRAEARTINAGLPAAGDLSPVGLAGGVLLAGAGLALGLRARRS